MYSIHWGGNRMYLGTKPLGRVRPSARRKPLSCLVGWKLGSRLSVGPASTTALCKLLRGDFQGLFHLFVLVVVQEDSGRAKAPLCGQVAHKPDHVPHLIVFEDTIPPRHASEADTIFNDPLQLSIRVSLNILSTQVRHRGRHPIGERNTGIVTIQSVTDLAVALEVPLTDLHYLRGVGHGILPILTADGDPLRFIRSQSFPFAGAANPARAQNQDAEH